MNANLISELIKAYQQSPENVSLLMVLVRELYNNQKEDEAFGYLNNANLQIKELSDRLFAANISLEVGQPLKAIEFCYEDSPEELLIKAKASVALFDFKSGLEAYKKAIAENPTLEDTSLEKTLNTKIVDISQRMGAKSGSFRVLSNSTGEGQSKDTEHQLLPFLQPEESKVTFKNVGGLEDIKKQIHRKIILPFEKPSLFQKFKKKVGGGVLLYGPPGCGKTLLARATSGECNAKFYNVMITDILDMWIGESEKKLNAIFEQARRTAPSVLFFDELEALAGKREYNTDSSSSKMVSQLLSEMDGFANNNHGVLILGATNVPWSIDPAFRRPGRFDRIQFVPPPDKEARDTILKILMEDKPKEENIDFGYLAKYTSGFSGADLVNLVESACDIAIEHSIDDGTEYPISSSFLKDALKDVQPSTTEWLTTARNYAKYSNDGGQYDDVINFLKKFGK